MQIWKVTTPDDVPLIGYYASPREAIGNAAWIFSPYVASGELTGERWGESESRWKLKFQSVPEMYHFTWESLERKQGEVVEFYGFDFFPFSSIELLLEEMLDLALHLLDALQIEVDCAVLYLHRGAEVRIERET